MLRIFADNSSPGTRSEKNTVAKAPRSPKTSVNSGDTGTLQKKGSEIQTEIVALPGGKVHADKDGSIIVTDAQGKQVVKMD